jgi:hypothetical protein
MIPRQQTVIRSLVLDQRDYARACTTYNIRWCKNVQNLCSAMLGWCSLSRPCLSSWATYPGSTSRRFRKRLGSTATTSVSSSKGLEHEVFSARACGPLTRLRHNQGLIVRFASSRYSSSMSERNALCT